MSNVPKSKRKKHDFETTKELRRLRKDITEAIILDFGYDPEKYEKMIAKFETRFQNLPNSDDVIRRMKIKHDSFYSQFIYKETEIVLDLWQRITSEFEMGNSIFPDGAALMEEYKERRIHFDRTIGLLHSLRLELQFIAETLPVDMNKYDNLAIRIKNLVSMVKGVRQSSNRFLKTKPDKAKNKKSEKPAKKEESNEAGSESSTASDS